MSRDVIVPFITGLSVTGDAELNTNETGSFAHANAADMDMSGSVSLAAWKGIFALAAPTSDASGDFTVDDVSGGAAAFQAAISAAMRVAVTTAAGETNGNAYNAAPSGSLLSEYLLNVAQHDMDADLQAQADGIAASLSAEQLSNLALTNLVAACDAAALALNEAFANSADHRKRLALQLTNEDYTDISENSDVPFEAGDSVTIRFNVSQAFSVTEVANNDQVEGGMAAPSGVHATAGGYSALYSVANRIIDMKLTLAAE